MKNKGSFVENRKMPEIGDPIYFLRGFNLTVSKGNVMNVFDIDHKGLANTYIDVLSEGKIYHTSLDTVFDHRPRKVEVTDAYGTIKIWQ